MEPTTLQITWFFLFGLLIAGYALLDGFDLGVGFFSLFTKTDEDRRILINSVGPVWDGNEVWLVTGGGALFAAFPSVYAVSFSSFYLAIMLLLLALIGRAVSMEFRGKVDAGQWRIIWDRVFGISSALAAVVFGIAAGNVMTGIPLNEDRHFTGTFLGLFSPHALLMGALTLAMFATHGALYLANKTDGNLQQGALRFARQSWITWIVLHAGGTVTAVVYAPHLFEGSLLNPLSIGAALFLIAGLALIPIGIRRQSYRLAFLGSSAGVVASVILMGAGLYPRLLPSSTDLLYSLTIQNASATETTLGTMFVIALLGMPLVVGYTIFIYRVFKGKVQITENSY